MRRSKLKSTSGAVYPEGLKLHHVGIVLRRRRQKELLNQLFPMNLLDSGEVKQYRAFCEMYSIGDIRIELIFPNSGSPLEKFNNGQGGIHHLAFEIAGDISEIMEIFRDRWDAVFLDPEPVTGIAEMKVAFLLPINTGGVTIELVQGEM